MPSGPSGLISQISGWPSGRGRNGGLLVAQEERAVCVEHEELAFQIFGGATILCLVMDEEIRYRFDVRSV